MLATYRLQFHAGFPLRAATRLVPYLQKLGISHLYASPLLQTRAGSLHGYDVINPLQLNNELGTEEDLEELCATLRAHGMGLILDIVPNHMALSAENPWWMDVLERGPRSPYARYFDLPSLLRDEAGSAGRLVLPLLGTPLEELLAKGELALGLTEQGVMLRFYDLRLPLALCSYYEILEQFAQKLLAAGNSEEDGMVRELRGWQGRLNELDAERKATAAAQPFSAEEAQEIDRLKGELYAAVERRREANEPDLLQLQMVLDEINGDPARLHEILKQQYYELVDLAGSLERINYRRFFDINELAGMRVEEPEVFARTHERMLDWVARGLVEGVRVDHIDGLARPTRYLRELREAMAQAMPSTGDEGETHEPYIIVEKILTGSEVLPPCWEIAGTTGYETIHALRAVQVTAGALAALESVYREFTGRSDPFAGTVLIQKRKVLSALFAAETANLAAQLQALAQGADCALDTHAVRTALELYTAHLPVYRTYIDEGGVPETDRGVLAHAYQQALPEADEATRRALDFMHRVALLENVKAEARDEWLAFLTRWQQYTGPAMAKGLEDTSFYIHVPLISLNEVGSGPDYDGLDLGALHRHNAYKQAHAPHGLNALSTHDTKRSEDARARLNVLSEMPERWRQKLKDWRAANQRYKVMLEGAEVPDANEEYLIYQSLLGELALGGETPRLIARMQAFAVKALREAKVHSTWYACNANYEEAVGRFIHDFLQLENEACIGEIRDFECELGFYGTLNSLAQLVLKNTMPGIPDTFQGQELWDFSLVDPDNRHAVNFAVRQRLLDEMLGEGGAPNLPELMRTWRDGRIKLFTTQRTLAARAAAPEVYRQGDYVPLEAEGRHYAHVFAFARSNGVAWEVICVPRQVTQLVAAQAWPLGGEVWGDTALRLPPGAPAEWHNRFTGAAHRAEDGRLPLGQLCADFPLVLLQGGR
jgi:(1->4)-alpha-D-glucan 1-alpha-D-glucosylmutase